MKKNKMKTNAPKQIDYESLFYRQIKRIFNVRGRFYAEAYIRCLESIKIDEVKVFDFVLGRKKAIDISQRALKSYLQEVKIAQAFKGVQVGK